MNTQTTEKIAPVQNIGLTDRIVRFFVGGALLAIGCLWMVEGGVAAYGLAIALLSIYPLMTTMMGWDPVYQMMGARSCRIEGDGNICGTFPFEVDNALGNRPIPNKSYDHSLSGSHHEKKHQQAA
jgi:hypothetical protein